MSVSAGTYTVGAGGNYANWASAMADIATFLTADLTFDQIANTSEIGVDIDNNVNCDLNTFTLTLKCSTPHNGDPLQSFSVECNSFRIRTSGRGACVIDDIYFVTHSNSFGVQITMGTVTTGTATLQLKNLLSNALGTGVGFIAFSPGSLGAGALAVFQSANCKFWAPRDAFEWVHGSTGPTAGQISIYAENNVFFLTSGASATYCPVSLTIAGADTSNFYAVFDVKNNVSWTGVNTQPALKINNDGSNHYGPLLSNNARNAGSDSYTWAYTGIVSPADILNIDPTLPDFLNDNHASALFTNGAVPVIPFNPYVSAPYPIGIAYASAPTGPEPSCMMPTFVPGV